MSQILKKVLKRTLGGLKMAAAYGPIVLFVGSALGFVGTGISALVFETKLEGYEDNPIYQQEYFKDIEAMKVQLDEGEISFKEYLEKSEEMNKRDYRNNVINRDIQGNEDWQKILKTHNALGVSALSLGGVAVATGIMTLLWYKTDIQESIQSSAEDDFTWETTKDKSKKIKDKPIKEKPNCNDDLNNDVEKLGSLDDFLNSLG